jgi:hypothetical protein
VSSRRLSVRVATKPAMTVSRLGIRHDKLCYIIKANKVIQYPDDRSRIVYIGTTQKGISRLASSAAFRAPQVLVERGIDSFSVHVLTCDSIPRKKTWLILERALLLTFRQQFGAVPLCNQHGVAMRERDEFEVFSPARLRRILYDL